MSRGRGITFRSDIDSLANQNSRKAIPRPRRSRWCIHHTLLWVCVARRTPRIDTCVTVPRRLLRRATCAGRSYVGVEAARPCASVPPHTYGSSRRAAVVRTPTVNARRAALCSQRVGHSRVRACGGTQHPFCGARVRVAPADAAAGGVARRDGCEERSGGVARFVNFEDFGAKHRSSQCLNKTWHPA